MSALSLIKKVKVQTLSFEKHPCRELEQEQMIHYLNGLALITNEDETVCEKEREYLSILINSFGLSEDMLETFVNFAENPDEKLILDMMQSFATKDIKYVFMVDAMMIASVDGNFDENEEALINEYFEMFKITPDEAKDLRYIYEMFYTQDGNTLYRYFGKQDKYDTFLIKKELFQYLIDYYKIDMAYELKEDEKRILDFEFFKPTFENGSLGDGATEIMTKPVSNAQFCIFLNSAFVSKTIEFNGEGKIVDSKTKDLLMDLEMSDIEFKDNEFVIKSAEDEEKKITGITYVMANKFIATMSIYNNEKYKLSHFHGDHNYERYFDTSNFKNEPLREFIIRTSRYGNERLYTIIDKEIGGIYLYLNRCNEIDKKITSNTFSFRIMKLPKENK